MPATYLLFRNYSCKIGHLLFLQLCRHNRRRPIWVRRVAILARFHCITEHVLLAEKFTHLNTSNTVMDTPRIQKVFDVVVYHHNHIIVTQGDVVLYHLESSGNY